MSPVCLQNFKSSPTTLNVLPKSCILIINVCTSTLSWTHFSSHPPPKISNRTTSIFNFQKIESVHLSSLGLNHELFPLKSSKHLHEGEERYGIGVQVQSNDAKSGLHLSYVHSNGASFSEPACTARQGYILRLIHLAHTKEGTPF